MLEERVNDIKAVSALLNVEAIMTWPVSNPDHWEARLGEKIEQEISVTPGWDALRIVNILDDLSLIRVEELLE